MEAAKDGAARWGLIEEEAEDAEDDASNEIDWVEKEMGVEVKCLP